MLLSPVLQNKILRVKSLGLKSTGNRKRPLDAMTWALSPDLKIAVKVNGTQDRRHGGTQA
jgi:hypothetical protein